MDASCKQPAFAGGYCPTSSAVALAGYWAFVGL
jgi:hypothetical protein